ncbi:uncharacterized protein [Oscarella lobularis]|uniref:uncharacterized protein n=1 Tax=Oscarella lobularis TaxID=121494 RepID=UPI003314275B
MLLLLFAVLSVQTAAVQLDASALCDGGDLLTKIRDLVPQWTTFCEVMDRTQLQITYVDNVLTIKVGATSGSSLSDLLPSTGISFLDDGKRIDIYSLVFNFNDPWSLTVKTRPYPNIEIVSGFLSVEGSTIDLTVGKGSGAIPLSLSSIDVSGEWVIGTERVSVTFKGADNVFLLSGKPTDGEISVGSFIGTLGQQLLPSGAEAALKQAGFNSFSLQNVAMTGSYDRTNNNFAFCFTGTPTISGWGQYRMHLLYHRYNGGAKQAVTLGVDFGSFQLSNLIKTVSGLDVSSVPLLGTVTVPDLGLLVSTADVSPNLLPDCVEGILKNTEPYPKGLSMVAQFQIASGVNPIKFLIKITPDAGVSLQKLDDSLSFTVTNVARGLGISVDSLPLPPGISNLLNAAVSSLDYDKTKGLLSARVSWGNQLVLIPGFLSIIDPYVDIVVKTTTPKKVQINAHGQWSIGSTSFSVAVEPKGDTSQGFVLTGCGSSFNIGDILATVGATFLPSGISIGFLRDFTIANPCVRIPVGQAIATSELFLSGEPRFGEVGGVTLNFVSKKINGQASAALGLDFANTGFADLLQKLTGVSISSVKLFDQGLKLGVIVSNADFLGTKFQGQTLSTLQIKKGLTLVGVFTLPSCGSDVICKFLEPIVGSASLQLTANFAKLSDFTVTAALANIPLGSGMTLQSAGLELAISSTTAPSVGIVCNLLVHDPLLLFEGSFNARPTGELEASLKMTGLWKQAFGIEWLTIGNLILSIKFIPGATPTAFEIGGEVAIGNPGKELKGAVYVGVDTTDPSKNYFFGSISELTINTLMIAFGIQTNLPRPLRELGFVEGVEVSYASLEKTVPGRTIPSGFKMKGTVNFLGFRIFADIHVSLGAFLKLDLAMSPLNLAGGIFKMYAHSSQKSRGPYLKADIDVSTSPPKVLIEASGSIELFSFIRMGATLVITDTEYIMEIKTPFFGVFQAYLKVRASYGSLQAASFSVYGELSTAWLDDLVKKVQGIIKKGADDATKKIADAQAEVDRAQRPLNSAQRDLTNAQNDVNRLCSIKRCSRLCIGCPSWDSCCTRVWGACIGCPGWNGCCTRIDDPLCVVANTACRALRGTAFAALEVAKVGVEAAKGPLIAAKAVLEGVKQTVKAGAAAASWIVANALTGLIHIRKISFNVGIHAVEGGRFGGAIEVSFLKRSYVRFSFSLRLRSPLDMAKDLADRVWSTISGRRRRDVEASLKSAFPEHVERLINPYRPGSYQPVKSRRARDGLPAMEPFSALTLQNDDPAKEAPDSDELKRNLKKELASVIAKGDEGRPHINATNQKFDRQPAESSGERCAFFQDRLEFLSDVVSALDGVYVGLEQEMKPFASQKANMGNCSFLSEYEEKGKKIENDFKLKDHSGEKDIQERIKIEHDKLVEARQICEDVTAVYWKNRDVLIEQNSRGLRNVMNEIEQLTKSTFGKTLRAFVNDLCDSLHSILENDSHEETRRLPDLVAGVCSVSNHTVIMH